MRTRCLGVPGQAYEQGHGLDRSDILDAKEIVRRTISIIGDRNSPCPAQRA
ncbi:hypothetical protein IFT67_12930 [Sphingomonas sp. CFBP 13728]|uniref:hypothetical protein n=1 Tax=Sphingomonas sp. CFBP 13728 TaxID=2775294 RepID=UPI001784A840|nr:hypothetical protein [Sphingomonas sp. CFBP 13728]MBD8619828.1 hypothetical protein [Sphingomonas sp. CFBP 13728]